MRRKKRAVISQKAQQAPRLLGGLLRGLPLLTCEGEGKKTMRPTAVRARKALFDALTHRETLREAFVAEKNSVWLLDAFAGCGALGLEALSRWQGRGVFVENNAAVCDVLRRNVERSGLEVRVLCIDALAPPPCPPNERETIRLGFFDPPYAMEEASKAPAAFAKQGWFAEGALVVLQGAARKKTSPLSLPLLGAAFCSLGTLPSSSACFFFFRYAPDRTNLRA